MGMYGWFHFCFLGNLKKVEQDVITIFVGFYFSATVMVFEV